MSDATPEKFMTAAREAYESLSVACISSSPIDFRSEDITIIARALMAAAKEADEAATKRCARLARITAPKDADFSGVWGEYEHGCDDTQGAIHAAILKGEGAP